MRRGADYAIGRLNALPVHTGLKLQNYQAAAHPRVG